MKQPASSPRLGPTIHPNPRARGARSRQPTALVCSMRGARTPNEHRDGGYVGDIGRTYVEPPRVYIPQGSQCGVPWPAASCGLCSATVDQLANPYSMTTGAPALVLLSTTRLIVPITPPSPLSMSRTAVRIAWRCSVLSSLNCTPKPIQVLGAGGGGPGTLVSNVFSTPYFELSIQRCGTEGTRLTRVVSEYRTPMSKSSFDTGSTFRSRGPTPASRPG